MAFTTESKSSKPELQQIESAEPSEWDKIFLEVYGEEKAIASYVAGAMLADAPEYVFGEIEDKGE